MQKIPKVLVSFKNPQELVIFLNCTHDVPPDPDLYCRQFAKKSQSMVAMLYKPFMFARTLSREFIFSTTISNVRFKNVRQDVVCAIIKLY